MPFRDYVMSLGSTAFGRILKNDKGICAAFIEAIEQELNDVQEELNHMAIAALTDEEDRLIALAQRGKVEAYDSLLAQAHHIITIQ